MSKTAHHAQNGFRSEQDKSSKAGGDALAAAELEPDGEQMAEHGEERRCGHDELLMRSAEQHPRHQNRSQTLGGVEQQSRNPERAGSDPKKRTREPAAGTCSEIDVARCVSRRDHGGDDSGERSWGWARRLRRLAAFTMERMDANRPGLSFFPFYCRGGNRFFVALADATRRFTAAAHGPCRFGAAWSCSRWA